MNFTIILCIRHFALSNFSCSPSLQTFVFSLVPFVNKVFGSFLINDTSYISGLSFPGSSASGSSRSQGGGNGGGGGSSGSSCRKMAMPLICGSVDGVSDQCSTLGSRRYSPNSSKVSMSLCSPYGGGAQLISTSHQQPLAFSVADSSEFF